jgi:hypothetical protein
MPSLIDLTSIDVTDLMNELDRLEIRVRDAKAALMPVIDRIKEITSQLGQLYADRHDSTEQIIKNITANVQRSTTMIIRKKKKQGRGVEEAREAAKDGGLFIAQKYGLSKLTNLMLTHIEEELGATYQSNSKRTKRRRLAVRYSLRTNKRDS